MSCCGKKREELQGYPGENSDSSISEFSGNNILNGEISFQYVGKKSMTVIGSVSRNQYFFSQNGEILSINIKDAPGMMGVPNIKKIKS